MPDLNPDQFFHGTAHDVKGGKILPANAAGTNVSEFSFGDPGDLSQGDHAFAIKGDEDYAWYAAQQFHRRAGRARVYEVEPSKDMRPGPWNPEHPDFHQHLDEWGYEDDGDHHQSEWASPTGFKIKNQIDIKPGHQGTFPSVDWNKYRDPGRYEDANHPPDYSVNRVSPLPEEPEETQGRSRQLFDQGHLL